MKVIAVACEDNRGLQGMVSAHFGRCPCYTLVEVEGGQIVGHRVVDNPNLHQHRPGAMPQLIRSLGVDAILAGGMGPRAVEMFHRFGIDVATGASGIVEDVVKAYLSGTMRGIVPCRHDHPDSCGQHHAGEPCLPDAAGPPRAIEGGASLVAIPAVDDSGLGAAMDPRFGRAPFFVLLDATSGDLVEIVPNIAAGAAQGAGPQAARLVGERGVRAVVAGSFGPQAAETLGAVGIELRTAPEGLTVAQAFAELMAGKLPRSS
jgi:predicted Fe-Mo cluster-binding NifX family protein